MTAFAVPHSVKAQGSRADYELSASYSKRTRNTVFRSRVEPHWFSNGSKFWYRIETAPNEYEFVRVDAETGEKQAAFDHSQLANALAEATGKKVSSNRLPFRSISFDESETHVRFRAYDTSWKYDFRKNILTQTDKETTLPNSKIINGVEPLTSWQPSGPSRIDTSVEIHNRIDAEAELFWIDQQGRRRSYGVIAPGKSKSQHTYASHVWLVENTSGKPLSLFRATDQQGTVTVDDVTTLTLKDRPRARRGSNSSRRSLSPDGRWRAVIRDHNLWIEPRSGEDSGKEAEPIQLSTDGEQGDAYEQRVYWSPDSRYLLALKNEVGDRREIHFIESSPDDQLQPKLHTMQYTKPGDRIDHSRPRLFNVGEQQMVEVSDELFPTPWSLTEFEWWPDSSGLTLLYNERGHQTLRVIEVDAIDGSTRMLIDEQSPTFIDYAGKTFLHRLDETGEIIWASERDGWNHLYLYDAETGKLKHQLTSGEWVVRGVERVDEQARQIWFRASGVMPEQDPCYVHLCRVDLDGSGFVVLTEGDGTHEWEFSDDGRFFLDRWSRVDQPPVTELRDAKDGRLICELEQPDWSRLLDTGWTPPERFVAPGRDEKTPIYGIIVRPTNFDPAKTYPVIEYIYAGPHSAFVPKAFSLQNRLYSMAELGFILVQIDGMGTSHRSKAFHDVCWKNLADSGFPDRIRWIEAAAADRPEMDLTRVGLYGGSAGGQSTLSGMLSHPDFYHVGSADCGCHDNRMDKIWWNELWMGYPIGPHYEEQSNVTRAHRLQGELQLIVGELDRNVDPASTMQVVDALIKADKDFELLVMPGTGHGAAGTPYAKRRLQDFFVRHLHNVEPRWTLQPDQPLTMTALKMPTEGEGNEPPLDDSARTMRAFIEQYDEDRSLLHRFYDLRYSRQRIEATREFVAKWQYRLEQFSFDTLKQDGQIDYLLLQNELEHERQRLDHLEKRNASAADLLPFAEIICQLHNDRRQNEDIKGDIAAKQLIAITEQIEQVRKSIDEKKLTPDRNAAVHAGDVIDALQRSLSDWQRFYTEYNPEFTWWTKQPYEATETTLNEYETFLREEIVGVDKDDTKTIIGKPIGRDALLTELNYEMIDYTPEELIAIGERELEWCHNELRKASQELGFGDDWHKALDHVKSLHVPPGEQPKLIKQLAEEAVQFLDERNLVTIPELCRRCWRMEMMTPERQQVNPYFTGGEVISVSFPTAGMAHHDKLMSMRGNNIHFSRATVQHELIPGHHLQMFMAQRYQPHRKLFRTPFLVEGWALYWEMLLWDLGFPQSPEDRIGMLFWRTHRAARIIFSLKFQLEQVTAEEAIDFLVENVGHERRNATAEVRRSVIGTYGPLYQAAYMLGGLQFLNLRSQLVDSGTMTDREFHDAILRENSIPIRLIRARLTNETLQSDGASRWRFDNAVEVDQ